VLGHSSGRFLAERTHVRPRLFSRIRKQLPAGGFVLAVWSSCLWPTGDRGEELAVALSTTLNATSANAWPARPFQALPRQFPGSILLRVFHSVPSDNGVRAESVMSSPATKRAAVLVIETDSISAIGPMLDLDNTRVTNDGLAQLGILSGLESLKVAGTTVDDSGLVRVGLFSSLIDLDVARTAVGDNGLVSIARLRGLKYLSLAGTHITDAGLSSLSRLSQLERLDLSGTAVTDHGMAHLRRTANLTFLNVENTGVTDRAIAALKQAHPKIDVSR
jgi:hypothetical protein